MAHSLDFTIANSEQIERALGERLAALRLSRNLTQADLAAAAGVSHSTIKRLERGDTTSLDTFIRVLTALRLQDHLATLLPDPGIRPVERVSGLKRERRRARPTGEAPAEPWAWADEDDA